MSLDQYLPVINGLTWSLSNGDNMNMITMGEPDSNYGEVKRRSGVPMRNSVLNNPELLRELSVQLPVSFTLELPDENLNMVQRTYPAGSASILQILGEINAWFHQPLSRAKILESYEDRTFGPEIKEKVSRGETPILLDVMADFNHFDGLHKLGDNVYTPIFG